MKNNCIHNIGGLEIDLTRVMCIGRLHGDSAYQRYSIYLEGNMELEIYNTNMNMDCVYPREDLVFLWNDVIHENN